MKNNLKIFGKVAIELIIIMIQCLYLVFIFKNTTSFANIIQIFIIAISFITIMTILYQNIPPETKLLWSITILLFPIFGTLTYLITHSPNSFLKLEKMIQKQTEESQKYKYNDNKTIQEIKTKNPKIYSQINYFHNEGFTIHKDCNTTYYPYGKETFQDILESLNQAKKFVFIEYFIISESEIWEEILSILKKKASNGVEVKIIYDDIGSAFHLKKDYIKLLSKYNIQISSFCPKNHLWEPATDNRDHRKMLIVDGEIAYIGGINIADECLKKTKKYGVWKDSSIKIKGNAVFEFTKMFLNIWNANSTVATNKNISLAKEYEFYKSKKISYSNSGYVIPYSHNPLNQRQIASDVYLNIINQATKYVYIYTPYLILNNVFKVALLLAAKRGVEIIIITPGIPDKKIVYQVTRSNYLELLEQGIKIYEYTPGFLHAKCMISDDEISTVGAVNLDYRSLYTHFENGCYFYKGEIIENMKEDFNKTLEDSKEISITDLPNNLLTKAWHIILNLFAPLL